MYLGQDRRAGPGATASTAIRATRTPRRCSSAVPVADPKKARARRRSCSRATSRARSTRRPAAASTRAARAPSRAVPRGRAAAGAQGARPGGGLPLPGRALAADGAARTSGTPRASSAPRRTRPGDDARGVARGVHPPAARARRARSAPRSMIAVPFAVAGRSALSAFGTACGVVSVPLFVGGIVSHMRGEYRTRHAASALDDRELARQERREGDRLSLGLFGLGAAFFAHRPHAGVARRGGPVRIRQHPARVRAGRARARSQAVSRTARSGRTGRGPSP